MTGAAYELSVPAGWWLVDLQPAQRRAQHVAALVQRQWRGVDDAPHLKAEARDHLQQQADEAAALGGVQLFLSVDAVEGVPLGASLLVTRAAMSTPAELGELVEQARAGGRAVEQVVLPGGRALRSLWREPPGPDDPAGLATTCVDWHVPVPGEPAVLLLQFRTPLEPLAEVLVELFDAVAATLRWTPGGPVPQYSPARTGTRGQRA